MRPLETPKKKCKPLLQRMEEDKAAQLERGSLMGSQYFTVQLPDGSYEKRLKVPVNVDPGVHSSFDLDEVIFIKIRSTSNEIDHSPKPFFFYLLLAD